MEKQRELIQQLEQQQHETEQRLEACSKDDEEDMLEQHQQQMDSIEHQHKIFDDMEFKQLEVVLLVNYLFKCSLRTCVDKIFVMASYGDRASFCSEKARLQKYCKCKVTKLSFLSMNCLIYRNNTYLLTELCSLRPSMKRRKNRYREN